LLLAEMIPGQIDVARSSHALASRSAAQFPSEADEPDHFLLHLLQRHRSTRHTVMIA
jgi:hypothetical protein